MKVPLVFGLSILGYSRKMVDPLEEAPHPLYKRDYYSPLNPTHWTFNGSVHTNYLLTVHVIYPNIDLFLFALGLRFKPPYRFPPKMYRPHFELFLLERCDV